MYGEAVLKNKERFLNPVDISTGELEKSMERALLRLEKDAHQFGDKMVQSTEGIIATNERGHSFNRYIATDKVTWKTGIWTGLYHLAYLYSGDDTFLKVAKSHLKHYIEASKHPELHNDHDTGFKFTPSCVAAYKITGDEEAREAALRAAKILLDHCCPVNKFVIRIGTSEIRQLDHYRILVDSMMNIALLFWAYEETKDEAYREAAIGHYSATARYLIREDGSSYHHYQFNPETLEPMYGVTHQGHRDESCWSRGHSWLLYGYPVAYRYTRDEEIKNIHKSVSYYFMDNLPKDALPYWDFDFTDGSYEPRDSSASAISLCGLYEMCKFLPDDSEDKLLYQNAADMMLKSLLEICENKNSQTDCLLGYVTNSRPHCQVIENCEPFGDYFFFEALVRKLKPDFELFW